MPIRLPDPLSLPYTLLRLIRLPPALHWRLAALANTRFLVGVYGVIVDEQRRVLLCRHSYRGDWPWGLPSGWMKRGETPLATIEREVREETGLSVRGERLVLIGTTADRPKLEFGVRGKLVGGEYRPSREVTAIRWCDPKDPEVPLGRRQRAILEQALDQPAGDVGWYEVPWDARRK